MSRSRRILLVVVLFIALAIGGAVLWSLFSPAGAGEDASEGASLDIGSAQAILSLANSLLAPRIAGLGLGLALGLAGGAGVTYVRRGGRS